MRQAVRLAFFYAVFSQFPHLILGFETNANEINGLDAVFRKTLIFGRAFGILR